METITFTPKDLARFWAKVDETGTCWTWTASKDRDGYGQIWFAGKLRVAHRIAYEIANGPIPTGKQLDHICRVPACVRPGHLRVVTNKQNQENLTGAYSNSRSGIRGVNWNSGRRKWAVGVQHNGKAYHGGLFTSLPEAEQAVIALRNRLFTHNELDRG